MVEEHWIEDLEEFEADSEEKPVGPRKTAKPKGFPRGKLSYLLLGGGAFLLLLLLLAGLLGGNDHEGAETRLDSLAASLSRMQKQIDGLEARQEKLLERISDLEPEYKFDTLFQNLNTLSNELEEVEKELRAEYASLQKKLSETGSAAGGKAAASGKSPSSGGSGQTGRVHVVEKGENLFRIGLKYDVSPKQIRVWNGLKPDEPIYPGQELTIRSSPGSD